MVPGSLFMALVIWFHSGIITQLHSQNRGEYTVRWVSQFPIEKGRSSGFADLFNRLVFGEKGCPVARPFNVCAVDSGSYWVLDQGAGRIFLVEEGKYELPRFIKRSEYSFPSLVGLCEGPPGNLLFTDSRMNRIFRIAGSEIWSFAVAVELDRPTGIAWNPLSEEVWVVETGAHRIAVLNSQGKLIRHIGSRGAGRGSFNFPTFIWVDNHGQVYIVDSMNFRIQVFDFTGKFIRSFGEGGDATGYMARPKGVATDSRGNIYVSDALFHAVQIFDPEGRYLYTFGSQGQENGAFWMPAGLYVDEQDYIYVADSYNGRIQVFQVEKKETQ